MPNRRLVPENLVPTLRAAGFTHLLLAEAKGPTAPNNGTLSRYVDADQAIEPGRLATLLEYDFHELDGVMRHYRLVELRGDASARTTAPRSDSPHTRPHAAAAGTLNVAAVCDRAATI